MEVLVIGCGIIGLSTAISLLKQNGKYQVTIIAKDLPPHTTSNKAAAVWFPYLANPAAKIGRWSNYTLEYLKKEAKIPGSGVFLQRAVELYPELPHDTEWTKGVPTIEIANEKDKPKGYEKTHGFAIEGAVADTDFYLNYLLNLYSQLGGKIIQKEVKELDEVFKNYNVVINCTGLGARQLVNDNTIYPTRGQTVVVKNKKFATTVMYEGSTEDDISYIIPRTNTTILGGTAQENNWNTNVDDNDTKNILRKAAILIPEFKDVDIVAVKVGLRPTRPIVRVELEKRIYNNETKLLIHNYGHGGSGYTIGWGCAADVVELVNDNIHLVKKLAKL